MLVKPIVQISNLVKKYAGATVNAVDSLELQITEGDIFGLLGQWSRKNYYNIDVMWAD